MKIYLDNNIFVYLENGILFRKDYLMVGVLTNHVFSFGEDTNR